MARKNRRGLLGTIKLRREDGSTISSEQEVWMVMKGIMRDYINNKVRIPVGFWFTKSDWENERSEASILGVDVKKEYRFDKNTRYIKGQDKHSGDGAETSFAFSKSNLGKEYISVIVDGSTKTLDLDYTVSYDAGDRGTGQVVFTTPPATGTDNIKLKRLQPLMDQLKPAKTKAEGKDDYEIIMDIIAAMDGSDDFDNIGIDYTSFAEDTTE